MGKTVRWRVLVKKEGLEISTVALASVCVVGLGEKNLTLFWSVFLKRLEPDFSRSLS